MRVCVTTQPERLDSPWRSVDLSVEKGIPDETHYLALNETAKTQVHDFKVYIQLGLTR